MNAFLKSYDHLSAFMDMLAKIMLVACIAVMTASTTLQVILRYFFNAALIWPEEVNLLLMPWVAFVGASIAIRRSEHIGISIFVDKLPYVPRKAVHLIGYILMGFVLVLLIKSGWKVAMLNLTSYSDAMRIPLVYSRIAVTVGSVMMLVQLVHVILKSFETKGSTVL